MRKALKILGIGLIVVLTLMIIFILSVDYSLVIFSEDVHYVNYPTYGAAVERDYGAGFMSAFLPHSANDIRYLMWFDDLWLSFNFDPGDISKIHQYCGGPVQGEIELAPEPPELFFIDWPEEITGEAPAKIEDITGYEFYRCELSAGVIPENDILAVNAETGEAYYYDRRAY